MKPRAANHLIGFNPLDTLLRASRPVVLPRGLSKKGFLILYDNRNLGASIGHFYIITIITIIPSNDFC